MKPPETNPPETSPATEGAGVAARVRAARVMADVLAGRSTLPEALARHTGAEADDGFVRELCFGTARHGFRLDHEVRCHLRQAPRERDLDVHALLLLGGYQLAHMDVPDHAAVHATVAAARSLNKPWASGLVNAVLRKLARADLLSDEASLPDAVRFNHPDWWLERLQAHWPNAWQDVVAAGNARPPMTLRSRRKRTLALAALAEAGIDAHAGSITDSAVYLARPLPVGSLPGFASGDLSVQDEGAQLAATLLGAQPGERILDACAAPGGKALHLAQMEPGAKVLALDVDRKRCARIRENVSRAQAAIEVKTGDGRQPESWWDGVPFDRILVDAPCSATGILRRQPDVRLLRHAEDLPVLARLQQDLLDALWPLLRNGGRLLYCTCSVLAEENDDVIAAFLAGHDDAESIEIAAAWGQATASGRQLLPSADAHDGFYFALLERRRSGS